MPSQEEPDDLTSAGRSASEDSTPSSPTSSARKRKRADPAHAELEVDVDAPEPPSKKAQRRAKKGKQPAPRRSSTSPSPDASDNANDNLGDAADGRKPRSRKDSATTAEAAGTGDGSAPAQRSEFAIWIGNLPWTATKEVLCAFLVSQAGVADEDVTRVHMPGPKGDAPRRPGVPAFHNRGFAYVDFSSLAAQQAAIGVSESLMGGSRRVLIKDARSFEGRPDAKDPVAKAKGDDDKPLSKRVFVGNLSYDIDAAALREHFTQCGAVADAFVATFEDSGKCKGYGWVTFEDVDGSSAAVRGFVFKEEDDGDGGVKKRKWWVNQLVGRRMRVEFAEDPSLRYKKRFGKDKPVDGEQADANGEEISGEGDGTVTSTRETRRDDRKPYNENRPYEKRRDPRTIRPGAALAKAMSERRNTGAIVEAKGKKITFD